MALNSISIHAPREGGDSSPLSSLRNPPVFQSTPPARGATDIVKELSRRDIDFNPRPPRGGRRSCRTGAMSARRFQSTPPARGATTRSACRRRWALHFNPRPPRGGRLVETRNGWNMDGFQSTPPARGATLRALLPIRHKGFQSTPPARGATHAHAGLGIMLQKHFNPRPPRGGRQQRCTVLSVNL